LKLAAGSSIEIIGGQIGAVQDCSNSDLLLGDVKIASCQGAGGLISFPDLLVNNGGYSPITVMRSKLNLYSGSSTITATASPSGG
jgi:hypothetical protein